MTLKHGRFAATAPRAGDAGHFAYDHHSPSTEPLQGGHRGGGGERGDGRGGETDGGDHAPMSTGGGGPHGHGGGGFGDGSSSEFMGLDSSDRQVSSMQSFIHSLIHSFTHSFVHSFIRSLIHSFIHSFVHSFVRSLIPSYSFARRIEVYTRTRNTRGGSYSQRPTDRIHHHIYVVYRYTATFVVGGGERLA